MPVVFGDVRDAMDRESAGCLECLQMLYNHADLKADGRAPLELALFARMCGELLQHEARVPAGAVAKVTLAILARGLSRSALETGRHHLRNAQAAVILDSITEIIEYACLRLARQWSAPPGAPVYVFDNDQNTP